MLKVFEMMEGRHLLDDGLTFVRDTLQLIRRSDVIENIVDRYNPNKPISVIVTKDAKSKFYSLSDTYYDYYDGLS